MVPYELDGIFLSPLRKNTTWIKGMIGLELSVLTIEQQDRS